MSELTIMKDGSVENLEDPNRLRISKPSFQNVKRNISSIATQGSITLTKIRDVLPEVPGQDVIERIASHPYMEAAMPGRIGTLALKIGEKAGVNPNLMLGGMLIGGLRSGKVPKVVSKSKNIIQSHKNISKSDWMSGAKKWYTKHFGTRPDPMRGYPQWTDETGEVYRATPGQKSKTNPAGPRNLTAVTKSSRTKMLQTRKANEDRWVGELKQVLDDFGSPEDFERYSTYIKAKNASQANRVKLLNNLLKRRGIKDAGRMLTIDHGGALKQGWPNLPDNRELLKTRKLNSAEGAIGDLPDFNIRMSGVSRSVREWVIRQKIRESFGPNADIMGNLPVSIKRKILKAEPIKNAKGKITKTVDDVVDDILQKYFKTTGK